MKLQACQNRCLFNLAKKLAFVRWLQLPYVPFFSLSQIPSTHFLSVRNYNLTMKVTIPRGDVCDGSSCDDSSLIVPGMSTTYRERNPVTDSVTNSRLSRPSLGRQSSTAAFVRTLRACRRSFETRLIRNYACKRLCFHLSQPPFKCVKLLSWSP